MPFGVPSRLFSISRGGVGGHAVSSAKDAYGVTVLGRLANRDVVASALGRWHERMAEPDSLEWARRRIAEAAGQPLA